MLMDTRLYLHDSSTHVYERFIDAQSLVRLSTVTTLPVWSQPHNKRGILLPRS